MSYVKQTWVTGDIITAEKLNHMEDGIAGAFPVAELVVEGNTFTVKATPETIDSVFAAVGYGAVLYRAVSGTNGIEGASASFIMVHGQNLELNRFVYDETAGGYVYNGSLG